MRASRSTTFANYQKVFRSAGASETEAGIDAQVSFIRTALLSEAKQRKILKGRNVAALIGAGIGCRLDATLDEALLQRAAQISPAIPVVWAALAYRSFSWIANGQTNNETMAVTCQNAVDQWQKLAPENAVPLDRSFAAGEMTAIQELAAKLGETF